MVGVQDHACVVQHRQSMNVLGGGDRAGDGRDLSVVGQSFTGVERRTAVGKLDDDRCVHLTSGFHDRIDRVRPGHVDSRQRVAVVLGVLENPSNPIARHDAGCDLLLESGHDSSSTC